MVKDAGSSLADVSDTSDMPGDDIGREPLGQTENMGRNSRQLGAFAASEFERRTMAARSHVGPEWASASARAARPELAIKVPQMPARAAAAIRGFSGPFRAVNAPAGRNSNQNAGFELKKLRSSYVSLGSESDEPLVSAGRRESNHGATPTAIERGLFGPGVLQGLGGGNSSLVAHEALLADPPRLPFPLVSLPEAARLQRFRRDRGEEDHTELPSSFAARARSTRSGTFSTMSSRSSPLTPLSPFGKARASARVSGPARSLTAHNARFSRKNDTGSFEASQSRLHSSAILGSSPMAATARRESEGPWHEVRLRDSRSILGVDVRRSRGFSPSTRPRRVAYAGEGLEQFSRSEAELIRSAREEMLFYRSMCGPENERQRAIFLCIMALTFVLPPIGLVALLGQFDSAISWYTHGEMHSLTKEQRSILKQQLVVEGVIYLCLIIALAVYFTRRP